MAWRLDWLREGADWPHRAQSHFVEAGGVRWHVQITGSGPAVLLLHGTGGATHSWAGVIDHLARHATLIAPDLPGHGFSSTCRGADISLPGMARSLGALCRTLGQAPDLIVGHSAGAAIALAMAHRSLAIPRRIIAFNGALTPFRGIAALLFPMMARALSLNPFTPSVVSRTASDPGSVDWLLRGTGSEVPAHTRALYAKLVASPGHIDGALRMMARWKLEPLEAAFPQITVPVTLVYGERDRAMPPQETRAAARALPETEEIMLPALGHLMHEEDPALLVDLILQRLQSAPVAGAVNHS